MLDHSTLLDLGAKAHIAALAQQIADVVTQLPNLKGYANKTIRDALGVETRVNGLDHSKVAAGLRQARKMRATRKKMSASERREVSKRMTAYWAKKRAEKKAAVKAAS